MLTEASVAGVAGIGRNPPRTFGPPQKQRDGGARGAFSHR